MRIVLVVIAAAVAGCTSTGSGHPSSSDAGAPDLYGVQAGADLASHDPTVFGDAGSSSSDLSVATADLAVAGDLAVRFGCSSDIKCYNANGCTTTTCFDACDNQVNTPDGFTLLGDLFGCIDTACPSSGGGVCDQTMTGYNATACQDCVKAAQTNGTCTTALQACVADG